MHRIDDEFSLPDANGPGRPGFTEGDPVAGLPPTRVRAEWLNAIQEELVGAIEESGLTLDKNDNTQLYQAIQRLRRADLAELALANWPVSQGWSGDLVSMTKEEQGGYVSITNAGAVFASVSGDVWSPSGEIPQGGISIKDVACEGGLWAAVGWDGHISESSDVGTTWTKMSATGLGSVDLACIAAGPLGGAVRFLAVGEDGSQGWAARRARSGGWSLTNLPLDYAVSVVWAEARGKFYAGGHKDGRAVVISSVNGQDWEEEFHSTKSGMVTDITYDLATEQVIAVGHRGSGGGLWWLEPAGGWNVKGEPWGPGPARVGWGVAANDGIVVASVGSGGVRGLWSGQIAGEWVQRPGAGSCVDGTRLPRWLGGRYWLIDEEYNLRSSLWNK